MTTSFFYQNKNFHDSAKNGCQHLAKFGLPKKQTSSPANHKSNVYRSPIRRSCKYCLIIFAIYLSACEKTLKAILLHPISTFGDIGNNVSLVITILFCYQICKRCGGTVSYAFVSISTKKIYQKTRAKDLSKNIMASLRIEQALLRLPAWRTN